MLASSFDVRVERQRVFDEPAVFQILLPPRNHVAAVPELGTREVAYERDAFYRNAERQVKNDHQTIKEFYTDILNFTVPEDGIGP
ncbi:hypothetical protein C473_00567 [Halorubrum distributum JCM 10247]|uniref:Uncharacterized protein n=1 Tax=Halorubrum distributum JCM 10247 TaxID=1227486 RepID=M0DRM5_9EURY|nr:hypothetical protein C473_00567 [Halorubrum terrestre JCM 10247]